MIRLPDIPGVNPTAIHAPKMNPAAAAAPAEALGNVAQAIANGGEMFHGIAMHTQKLENARKESEARMALATDYAALQLELQKEQDPSARIARTQEFFTGYKGRMDSDEYPPAVRASLLQHFDEEAGKGMIRATADAAQLEGRRARQAFDNEIQQAPDMGAAMNAIDRYAATGDATPEEIEAMKYQTGKKFEHQARLQEIGENPRGWLAANPSDQVPAGYDPAAWSNLRNYARGQLRELTYSATSDIQDGIASGGITRPEQIDALAGDLRPAAREELKRHLAARHEAGFQAMTQTPEYQQATVGRVAALLADYSPESENFDADFVEMDALVRTLPLGAARSELTRQIKAVREGRSADEEIKTAGAAGSKALDVAFKAGRFGKVPSGEIMPTGRAINDGFLRDPDKLASLGFSKDQVKEIVGKADDGDSKRSGRFKTLWVQRENKEAAPERVAAATARAILNGKTSVDLTDKELEDAIVSARMQAELSYGRAKTDFAEWLKINPDASSKEVEDKIFNLAGEEARKSVSSGLLPAKPTRGGGPKGADESTSAVPKGGNLREVIKHFEAGGAPGGFHQKAYWDYGQWSIGYGTKSKEGETISKAEGEKRLDAELASHRARVERATAKAGLKLEPHQLDALTSFDYNTGSIEKLLAGGTRSKAEIAEVMLLYRNAGGKRLRGLENRRAAERQLFLNGYGDA